MTISSFFLPSQSEYTQFFATNLYLCYNIKLFRVAENVEVISAEAGKKEPEQTTNR